MTLSSSPYGGQSRTPREQHAFVESVARRLARDENDADDISQDTWLATHSRPEGWEGASRGLLAVIAKRRSTLLSRQRLRRGELERLSFHEQTQKSPLETLAERGTHQAVRASLAQLDSKYREVIHLRYFEELDYREIADRIEVPVETVRTRLKRGLERLRSRFETDGKLDRSQWGLLIAGWAWEERKLRGTIEGVAGIGASVTLLQLLRRFALPFGLALTSVLVWIGLGGASRSVDSPPETDVQVLATAAAEAPAETTPLGEEETTSVQVPSGPARLRVELRGRATGAALEGVRVRMKPLDFDAGDPRTVVTDATGAAAFEELAPGHYLLESDRGHARAVRLEAGTERSLTWLIDGEYRVSGVVRTQDGQPLPFARVAVFPDETSDESWIGAECDGAGRYEIENLPASVLLGARRSGFAPGRLHRLLDKEALFDTDSSVELDLRVLGKTAAIDGFVLDAADGRPIAGATVRFSGRRGSTGLQKFMLEGGITFPAPFPETVTDEAGRFTLDQMPNGWSASLSADAIGYAHEELMLAKDKETLLNGQQLIFRLEPGAEIRGRVVDRQAAPRRDVIVQATSQRTGRVRSVRTGADGTFELDELERARHEVRVLDPGAEADACASRTFDLRSERSAEWAIELGPGSGIFGTIESAESLAGCRLELRPEPAPDADRAPEFLDRRSVQRLGSNGVFGFPLATEGRYSLRLWSAEDEGVPLQRWANLTASGQALQLVATDTADGLAEVTGQLGGPRARWGRLELRSADDLWGPLAVRVDPSTGRFRVQDLWPGRYFLFSVAPDHAPIHLAQFDLEASQRRDLGHVTPPALGSVLVQLKGKPFGIGHANKGTFSLTSRFGGIRFFRLATADCGLERLDRERLRIDGLPPGDYDLSLRADMLRSLSATFTVREGEERVLPFPLGGGANGWLVATVPGHSSDPDSTFFVVEHEASGRRVIVSPGYPERRASGDRYEAFFSLELGHWRMTAYSGSLYAKAEFDVHAYGPVEILPDAWRPVPEDHEIPLSGRERVRRGLPIVDMCE